jgi:glycosyltransferase involved in cell wall biosynthesis
MCVSAPATPPVRWEFEFIGTPSPTDGARGMKALFADSVTARDEVTAAKAATLRSCRPVVSLVFKSLYQYRTSFCEHLRNQLDSKGIALRVIHGQPGREDAPKLDSVELPWAQRIRNTVIPVGKRELFWQPALPLLRGSDLVVVEVASKLLLNYVLMAQQVLGNRRLAFLGHGFNARERPGTRGGEFLKAAMSRRVHWWFAYNDVSLAAVARLGFPRERITNIQNAIDTRALVRFREAVTPAQVEALRHTLGIQGRNVGLFLGGMYPDKLLPFLLAACQQIRREIPDFEVVFLGAGPSADVVRTASAEFSWVHYVTPKFDRDKVPYCLLAKVLLMPGAVGLSVLDAFALQLPLITIADRYHGPEFSYLEPEVNGLILPASTTAPEAYAAEVAALLRDEERLARLRQGCARASQVYTVEEMSRRFADGLALALRP